MKKLLLAGKNLPQRLTILPAPGKLLLERGSSMAKPRKNKAVARKQVKAARDKVPTAAQIAAFVGVPLAKPLSAEQSRRLIKPMPGYHAVMDNVAANLREDNDILELSYDPEEVEQRLARAADLAVRNGLLYQVGAGSDGARQVEDGFLMKVLLDCVRRINEESQTHPELLAKWKPILDFVRKNRPGRTGGAKDSPPTT